MILDTLILENFGVFRGRQEVVLTPEPGKPIILFGGLNGGGKTTLLDAIQLAFYGPKASISNRGRRPYKDYLHESIHRACDAAEGAGVTIRFRRMIDGETHSFELGRRWRQGAKGIEESVRVLRDGKIDDVFTDHWDEVIEAYLPSSIAHLFFFDGEQITALAEGGHAAEILGTAVHSLLGLDLVDRLEIDLKVLERRKRSECLDNDGSARLADLRRELDQVDSVQEQVCVNEGALVNEAGRMAKLLERWEETFRAEGGELYQQRASLETALANLKARRTQVDVVLRDLVAGPLPLILIEPLLAQAEQQARHERNVRQAKALVEVLEERDTQVLASVEGNGVTPHAIKIIAEAMAKDRQQRNGLAAEPLLLDAPEDIAPHINHLRNVVLPRIQEEACKSAEELALLDEQMARAEADLVRTPAADRIAIVQAELDSARRAHAEKLEELDVLRLRKDSLRKARAAIEMQLDTLGATEVDVQLAADDRLRILKHSQRVRSTLDRFRTRIVKEHATNMEALMLESFQKLLRKSGLVTGLTIDPETFEATLSGRDGKPLPFDRLSAGERQLLATSMLWGLARASGRPIPTVIDTPLGRLDSDHRANLIERYFPNASHQVLLLSTDEEIVNGYLDTLKPYVTRTFLLTHVEWEGATTINTGYFTS